MLQEYFFFKQVCIHGTDGRMDSRTDGWMDRWTHIKPKKPRHENIHFHHFFPAGVIVENDTQLQNNQLFTL